MRFLLSFLPLVLIPTLPAAEVVKAGAGSYLNGLPAGVKGPPEMIYKTGDVKGPMPTNDWWSSLAWMPLSDSMFPHPLAVKAVESGLRIWYPGSAIGASEAAIMGGGGEDLVIGHSAVAEFSEARVAGWSDWFVTAQMGEKTKGMRLTFGHGSPFVFAEYSGGEPVVTMNQEATLFQGGETDAVLGVKMGARFYGLFAPAGSTWKGIGTTSLSANTHGKSYFTIALLPDDSAATLELFRKHAYAPVTDSKVAWSYDPRSATVKTKFSVTTKQQEDSSPGTLLALYPHQWRDTDASLTGKTYQSVRGPMKLATGAGFSSTASLPAVLPSLPLTASVDKAELRKNLALDLKDPPQLTGDTYWLGKQLGKWGTMIPLAEQAGDTAAVEECTRRIRTAMESFLTANDPTDADVFAYEPKWGTLIGYPSSYGSDQELNDHHFHYGYFLRAAGELARRDPAWAAKWKDMLELLTRDVVSTDREDKMFPFLRCFDPYAGHSWASGHAKFGDGNNNESSSEAANAWFGLLLLGEVTGDKALRDLGAWLYATEISAIEDYWFDVRGDLFPVTYRPSVVTMVWGGKGANGTWFSGNPEAVHGINFLPVTGASLYLGRWPEYVEKNYAALVKENLAVDITTALKEKKPSPTHDGTAFDQWADVMWMYRALTDPTDALSMWQKRPADFKPEAGNSLSATYAWLNIFMDLGKMDRNISADIPFAAVFQKDGKRRYVGWNVSNAPITVRFSDGTLLECPAKQVKTKP